MKKERLRSNPMAKDLRQPKYRQRVVMEKKKTIYRKRKHKGDSDAYKNSEGN
jgi:hypothetical protein